MLTSIIKATRAHYAALQHRPSPDRVALDYEVPGHTAGTVWVKAPTQALRRANLTRLLKRLHAMYPEYRNISAGFRDSLNGVGPPTKWPVQQPVRNVSLSVQCVRCGQIGAGPCGCGFQQPVKTWKPQVKVQGDWAGNALVFATEAEAYENAKNLFGRWILCEDYRAVESTEAVNYKWVNGQLEKVK